MNDTLRPVVTFDVSQCSRQELEEQLLHADILIEDLVRENEYLRGRVEYAVS